jgi:iron-sulfur cluster repair protein YtfE (RIC family)
MSNAASATTFDTATAYLSWDHDRLDALLHSASNWAESGEWTHARRAYAEFDRGLDRHIRLEEEILFPLFEDRTGAAGPTTVMREEHELIRGVLDVLRDAVERGDARAFGAGLAALGSLLPPHNDKEEQILYPTTDRVLPERERAALAVRLQTA